MASTVTRHQNNPGPNQTAAPRRLLSSLFDLFHLRSSTAPRPAVPARASRSFTYLPRRSSKSRMMLGSSMNTTRAGSRRRAPFSLIHTGRDRDPQNLTLHLFRFPCRFLTSESFHLDCRRVSAISSVMTVTYTATLSDIDRCRLFFFWFQHHTFLALHRLALLIS